MGSGRCMTGLREGGGGSMGAIGKHGRVMWQSSESRGVRDKC